MVWVWFRYGWRMAPVCTGFGNDPTDLNSETCMTIEVSEVGGRSDKVGHLRVESELCKFLKLSRNVAPADMCLLCESNK